MLWIYLLAVLLPVSARSFVPPQLETHHGPDQIHHHGDKEEDDGGRLARLCSAEGAVHAAVEDRVGAEPTASCVSDIDDSWATSSKCVRQRNIFHLNPKVVVKNVTARKQAIVNESMNGLGTISCSFLQPF